MAMIFPDFKFNGLIWVPVARNPPTSTCSAEVEKKIPSLEEMNRITRRLMMRKLQETLEAIIAKRTGGCQVYPSDEYRGYYWIVPLRREGETNERLAKRSVLIDGRLSTPSQFCPHSLIERILQRRFV